MPAQILDVRGQSCPLPVVEAARAIATLPPGGRLEIVATDRGSISDIPAWCRTTGNVLVERSEADGEFRFLVEKAS